MLWYPEVQNKAQAELDAVLGQGHFLFVLRAIRRAMLQDGATYPDPSAIEIQPGRFTKDGLLDSDVKDLLNSEATVSWPVYSPSVSLACHSVYSLFFPNFKGGR